MTADQLTTALLDMPLADVEERLREGALMAQRHFLYDADPDSKVPPFVCLDKGVKQVTL